MPKAKLLKNIFIAEANIGRELERYNIDTSVNAAKPLLMGNGQGETAQLVQRLIS